MYIIVFKEEVPKKKKRVEHMRSSVIIMRQ